MEHLSVDQSTELRAIQSGLRQCAERWIAAGFPPGPFVAGGYSTTANQFIHEAEHAWFTADQSRP